MSTAPKIIMPPNPVPDVPGVPAGQQPVDRSRRFRLIWTVVLYCITSSIAFTLMAAFGIVHEVYFSLVQNFVDAAMALAGAATLAYVTGSVVDYNGGIGGMVSTRRYAAPDNTPKG